MKKSELRQIIREELLNEAGWKLQRVYDIADDVYNALDECEGELRKDKGLTAKLSSNFRKIMSIWNKMEHDMRKHSKEMK